MEQELISLANAIKELSVYRDSKEEALTEITHHIRNKNLRAYATSRGWIIIEKLDKRGNGNYYIETNESYSIEGFITPCELPLLEVAHSIHLIRKQFDDVFELSAIDNKEQTKINDLQDAKAGKKTLEKEKSYKPRAPHNKAIHLALNELGDDAENEDIFEWIKVKTDNGAKGCYVKLDFNNEDVMGFDTTDQEACVMISNGNQLFKGEFQSAVSRVKACRRIGKIYTI